MVLSCLTLILLTSYAQNYSQFKGANGKFGFKNSQGAIVIPALYEESYNYKFQFGMMRVFLNGNTGFIDSVGKLIIPFKKWHIDEFDQLGFSEVMISEKFGVMNRKGVIVIPCKYSLIYLSEDRTGLIRAKLGDEVGGEGVLDTLGNIMVPFIYDGCMPRSKNLIIVDKNHKHGVYNTAKDEVYQNGKEQHSLIVVPVIYDFIKISIVDKKEFIYVSLISNNKTGKPGRGLFDGHGRVIVECTKMGIGEFNNGRAEVEELDGTKYYIDEDGNTIE